MNRRLVATIALGGACKKDADCDNLAHFYANQKH